jgi:hypothetical protein
MRVVHWTRRLGLGLVVGSLVTVAVAWYGEVRTPVPRMVSVAGSSWPVSVPSDWPGQPQGCQTGTTAIRQWTVWYSAPSMHESYNAFVNKSGWPCLAMRYASINHAVLEPPNAGLHETDGLRLPARWNRRGDLNIAPLIPVLPGFAIDAAAYGGAAMLLWSGQATLLRGRRRARGRCSACGYDRRGLASATAQCPECGAVPRVASALQG